MLKSTTQNWAVSNYQVSATSLRPVLVAEDDEGDAMLLRLAFSRAQIQHPLMVVQDGAEAVDYLMGNAAYADREVYPLPSLLLLDPKMPRLDGFDVLEWWASRSEFRGLPVIVFSSSSHETDIDRARRMGAREYVVKPNGFTQLANLVQELCERWLSAVLT